MQEHFNNGFFSCWKVLRRANPLKGFFGDLQTAFHLIGQIFRDAGVELFFLLLFWIIITKMSQGRDIVVSLFEPEGLYSDGRIFYTILAVMSLSLSMWLIPAFLFQLRDNKNNNRRRYKSIFRQHVFFIHRVIPLVPFWLLAFVLFNGKYTWLWFLLFSAGELGLLWLFYGLFNNWKQRRIAGAVLIVTLMIAMIIFFRVFETTYLTAKIVFSIVLYLLAFITYIGYHQADAEILKEHDQEIQERNPVKRYSINSIIYFALALLHVFIVFKLFRTARISLAPESILLYIFSLNVFAIDLFVYLTNITPKIKVIVGTILLIVFILFLTPLLNFNLSHYTVDRIKYQTVLHGKKRLGFEARYQELKKKIEADTSKGPYPIVLISGEGGGSRAALWFSQNLINFDYLTQGRFRDHIFSVSTVSGSTVGLETVFSFWEKTSPGPIHTNWLDVPYTAYSNNFVGSSINGLLLTDLWKTMVPGHWERDRNTVLQDEEAYETELACRMAMGQEYTNLPDEDLLLRKDFMDFFYEKAGDSVRFKNRPLVLINTCRSNDGRRGIISPVKLVDSVFNYAVDIGGYLYDDLFFKNTKSTDTSARNISFEEACNTSELFPLFSAPMYYDSLGSFVDGGYHENSGLKTTLDVYQKLQKMLSIDPPKWKGGDSVKRCEIYIVYLKNSSGEKNLYRPVKSGLPFELPLEALTNQPFEGSESFFEERARLTADTVGTMQFIQLQLDNKFVVDSTNSSAIETGGRRTIEQEILRDLRSSDDTTKLNFPLARWLSKSISKRIRFVSIPAKPLGRRDSSDKRMVVLLESIQNRYGLPEVDKKPFENWDPNHKRNINQEEQTTEKEVDSADRSRIIPPKPSFTKAIHKEKGRSK